MKQAYRKEILNKLIKFSIYILVFFFNNELLCYYSYKRAYYLKEILLAEYHWNQRHWFTGFAQIVCILNLKERANQLGNGNGTCHK